MSVTIPNSVTIIKNDAFRECIGLIEIINESATPQPITSSVFPYVISTCTLRVPAASIYAYSVAYMWEHFGNIVAI